MLEGRLLRFISPINMVHCPQGVIELDPYNDNSCNVVPTTKMGCIS